MDGFEPKVLVLQNLPKINLQEYRDLPGKLKGEILALYMIAVIEAINGRDMDDSSCG
ncbi:MAG: hypothetical protein ABSB41_19780 [Anaerolineales bacterium]